MAIAQEAAVSVLGTLSFADYVGIVEVNVCRKCRALILLQFNSDVSSPFHYLIQATAWNVDYLKNYIFSLYAVPFVVTV